jgi:hypothetical protein
MFLHCCSFFSLVYCGNTVFDIPELVVPIMICLVEGCCQQGTKGSQWLGLSDHFESITSTTMIWLTVTEYMCHK